MKKCALINGCGQFEYLKHDRKLPKPVQKEKYLLMVPLLKHRD